MKYGNDDRKAKRNRVKELYAEDYDYEYPNGLDLHPDSELTKKIVNEILDRAELAQEELDSIKDDMKEMDRNMTAYMYADEWDSDVAAHDPRRPTTVVVPMCFAMRETFQTSMRNALTTGDLVHLYRGTSGPESKIAAAKLELLVGKQSLWFKERLALDMAFGDAFTYGRGLVALNWAKHLGKAPVVEEVSALTSFALAQEGVSVPPGTIYRYLEDRIMFEGTKLTNIDMYQTFIDPSVPPNDIQEAEYVGWMYRTNAMSLLRREQDPEEFLFNGRAVYHLTKKGEGRSAYWNREDGRARDGDSQEIGDFSAAGQYSNVVDVIRLCVELIPEEWGIGDGKIPEKWIFEVAGDSVIIQAMPLPYKHNMFPVAMFAPNADAHTVAPGSHLMTTASIQKFMNWLLKSRADAVNTILNGLIFYDPSMVEEEDMLNPGQGKLVRVRNTAYGEARISDHVHQFVMADPTAGHMANIAELDQIARNANGTGDMVMGRPDQLPERPTAAGINAFQSSSFSRLDMIAARLDEQAMRDIGYQMGYNSIQLMSEEVQAKMTSRQERILRNEYGLGEDVPISPWDIANLTFEVEPRTAIRPGIDDTAAMSELMKTLMAVEGVGQQIAMKYDPDRIFAALIRKLGFDDIEDFRNEGGQMPVPNMQVMPDQMVQQQAQAGNLVGLGG